MVIGTEEDSTTKTVQAMLEAGTIGDVEEYLKCNLSELGQTDIEFKVHMNDHQNPNKNNQLISIMDLYISNIEVFCRHSNIYYTEKVNKLKEEIKFLSTKISKLEDNEKFLVDCLEK